MADLGTAYVQIVPKAEGISGKITEVMSGEAGKAGIQTGGLFTKGFAGKVAKGAAVAGAAMAAGIGLGANALKNGIKATAEYGDRVDKMSQKIGFSAEEYQKWDYVLQRAGTDIGKMAPVMKTLSSAAASNSTAFQQLGISQQQVANMSQGELFSKTIEQLSQMEDKTQRTALASQLLGRGATELGPLLNGGTQAIKDQMAIAEKYGMVMSDKAVKASADFQDSLTTMQMTMTGLKNRMMAEFLPAATKVTDGIGKMFAGDMSGLDDVVEGIEGIASKCAEMAPKLLEAGGKLISQLIKGLLSKSGNIGATVGTLAGKIVAKLIAAAPKLLAAGVKLIVGLVKGLVSALPQIATAISTIVKNIVQKFKETDWKAVGSRVLELVVKGIKSIVSSLNTLVRDIVKKVIKFFGFDGLLNNVRDTFNNVKTAISDKIEEAKEKVKSVIETIKGYFPFNIGKVFKGWIPKIKLWTNKTDDGASTSSSVEQDGFAKAMSQPYTFKRPTQFYAGEAGDETLFGRSALLADMRKAVSGADKKPNQITNYFTINNADDPEAVADAITRRLSLQMRSA